ncbi:PAS domain S-box protein [Methylococcus geothermalis]|uniref:PAS domain S-box protein n=1 Tax=Methylococcus geothermalis TaxID=2681310 RepID=A0A858Q7R3_9GAMM|nr:PAS domain S-box protein [Methylococcus geothermalis]QJD29942.1 PAS domain S-box protein [Methylococcus geothermalis]
MTRLEPEATVLGRLLVIQETLDVLPDTAGIAAFLDAALAEVPGVAGAHLCVDGKLMPASSDLDAVCDGLEMNPARLVAGPLGEGARLFIYPLRIAARCYGVLLLRLSEPAQFQNYRDFLGNIANVVARTLENRAYVAELARSNRLLEQRVDERTRALSEKTAELQRECEIRRAVQDDLAESEEKFRQISTAALDAIAIIDGRGRVMYWNPAAEAMFGYLSDEIVGRDLHEVLAPERYLGPYRAGIAEFQRSGTGAAIGLTREMYAMRKDGSEFPIELSVSSVKIRGEWIAIGVIRDITERKHADALKARLAAIVESSEDAILANTLDGIITSWNAGAERMFGYRAEEIIGQPVTRLVPPELHGEIRRCLAEVANGRAVRNLEIRSMTRSGAQFDVSLTISPVRGEEGKVVGASAIGRDITEFKRSEQALRRLNRVLKTVTGCDSVLVRARSEAELLGEMCRVIADVGGYGKAWVGVLPEGPNAHVPPEVYHSETPGIADCVSRLRKREVFDSILRSVGHSGIRRVVREIDEASPLFPLCHYAAEQGCDAFALIPIRNGPDVAGMLGLCAETLEAFEGDEMALLEKLAGDMAYGIAHLRDQAERLKNADRITRSLEQTIQAVATTLEMRDPYTAGHQRRVADLAAAIAKKLNLSEDEVHGIRLAGMVHDLGKIRIPAEILTKPGRLTPLEFDFIKTHPQVGYDILKDVAFPWPIADMVLQHHERLDGSGYPQGLAGDAILLGARIIAVADVMEAMSSHRPYRPGLGKEAALAELEARRGSWYDARVVDACKALFRDEGYPLQ